MLTMITLSLLLNIAVLVPVCFSIITHADWVPSAYGGATQARDILFSVYLAIGLASIVLLFLRDPKMIAMLLIIQIVYKFISPITVGTIANPVVASNIAIAAFHCVTLFVIWRTLQAS